MPGPPPSGLPVRVRAPRRPGSWSSKRPWEGAMHRVDRRVLWLVTVLAGLVCPGSASAASTAHAAQASSEVVALDRDLVRLDTSNPPGNEGQVANYMRDRLAPLGFEVDVVQTPTRGKAHLLPRLRTATPTAKPVLLAAHEDTVGVERELWSVDPFAGVISGDY